MNLKSTSREIACDASSDKALRSKVVTLAQAVRSAPGRPIVLFLLVVLSAGWAEELPVPECGVPLLPPPRTDYRQGR